MKCQILFQAVPDKTLTLPDAGCCVPLTIGNIPHKISFPAFQTRENMPAMAMQEKYPALPGLTGDKYIAYRAK